MRYHSAVATWTEQPLATAVTMHPTKLQSLAFTMALALTSGCTGRSSVPEAIRSWKCGEEVERLHGIAIYSNGLSINSCVEGEGQRNRAPDGYSYGLKWQCVEFVRRYYKEHLGHSMPSQWGNARDYFRADVPHGELNSERGLVQLHNGGPVPPVANDLVVFQDAAGGLGHVAIIAEVSEDSIVLAQQNSLPALVTVSLDHDDGVWTIGDGATGFLRRTPPGP